MKSNSLLLFLFVLSMIFSTFCNAPSKLNSQSMSPKNKTSVPASDSTQIIRGLIVEKLFVNKVGKASDFKEMYFRLSVQDYFIKFCESKITKAQLQAHLDSLPEAGPMGDKAVTLEIEIKNGEWDSCDEEYPVQSRVGDYIVVYRIVD